MDVEAWRRRSPVVPFALTITWRFSGVIDSTTWSKSASAQSRGGGWPWKSIDRKLRARHRMLRHDQRRPRLVFRGYSAAEIPARGLRRAAAESGRGEPSAGASVRHRARRRPRRPDSARRFDEPDAHGGGQCGEQGVFHRKIAASRKPNSVPASAACAASAADDHSSSPHRCRGQATYPEAAADGPSAAAFAADLPIWSCSVRGFACHRCCHRRGALLPHLFTLALRELGRGRIARSRGMFSVPLSFRVAPTGRYPAHCPAEFGLSSRLRPPTLRWASCTRSNEVASLPAEARKRKTGDRLARCDTAIVHGACRYPSVSCEI